MRSAPFGDFRRLGVAIVLLLPAFAQDDFLAKLIVQGRDLESAGKFAKAEEVFRQALKEAQKNPDPFFKVSALDGLASTAADQARYVDAERELLDALAIASRSLGPNSRAAAAVLWHLIGVYEECGKRALAEPLLRRFESIALTNTEASPETTAAQLSSLGWIYSSRGNNKKALPYFNRAVSIFEKIPGEESDLLRTLLDRAAVLLFLRDFDAALSDLDRTRALLTHLSQASPALEIALAVCTGAAYAQTHRMSDADSAFAHAKETAEAFYGAAHPIVALVLADYAGILRTVGRKKEASDIAATAKRIARANPQSRTLGSAIDVHALISRQ